jgi:hypothetical protein
MIKRILRTIDDVLLGKAVHHYRYGKWIAEHIKELEGSQEYRFVVHYQKSSRDLLSRLCDEYGSDKGEANATRHPYPWPSHTYADFYSRLFSHCRHGVKKVFECGIGTNNFNLASSMGIEGKPGASLRMWSEYFPNATIIGADIDRNILFEEGRIRTFYVDQLDPLAISFLWEQAGTDNFDLIIDDGLHTFEAGSCLFEHSISKLADWGIYIIEDVETPDLLKYANFFNQEKYTVDYVNLYRPNVPLADNSLVVIRHR